MTFECFGETRKPHNPGRLGQSLRHFLLVGESGAKHTIPIESMYLEPVCPLFLALTPPKQGPKSNQNSQVIWFPGMVLLAYLLW